MNKKLIGNIIGVILLLVALFGSTIDLPSPIVPKPAINLDVDKPTQDILDLVDPINKLITNEDDRVKIAVFNYVFSKRVESYETDVQKLNDVYVLAAQNFFADSIKDKYDGLDTKLQALFNGIVGADNHTLTKDEKISVKNTFGGLAWRLIQ